MFTVQRYIPCPNSVIFKLQHDLTRHMLALPFASNNAGKVRK